MKKKSQLQVEQEISLPSIESLITKYLDSHPEINEQAKKAVSEDLQKITKKSLN